MEGLNYIVKMQFGSHLYGTATPDSDLDYKGVFLPSRSQVFLGRIPKSHSNSKKKAKGEKNTSEDIDTEIYSLHYFLKLACEGQTVALDMLHAPENMISKNSRLWYLIVAQRKRFYTRSLTAFIGYARRQAAKYGIKGSRLNAAKMVVDKLKSFDPDSRLRDVWERLPNGEHIYFLPLDKNGLKQYQVCGKAFQETVRVGYITPILENFLAEYGKRAILAAENKGIDWKAISHALRAAYQTREILTDNTIIFPLKQAGFLRTVKEGKLDYLTEVVPVLENLMDEVEALSKESTLPLKADREYWDNFLVSTLNEELWP